jgi:rhodanese-related sulfurtransferase
MARFVDASFVEGALESGDAVVLNVLSEEQYEDSHIPGSVNAPLESDRFRDLVRRLIPDKSTPVITHCSSTTCQASTTAAHQLEAMGYEQVSDFKAGMEGWTELGLVTESGPGPVEVPAAPAPSSSPERPPRTRSHRPGRGPTPRTPRTP